MFRNTYQGGFLSILYSCGSSPLELWDMHVKNGYIRRITDEEIKSLALEIAGTNVATTYIYCPAYPKKELGIKLPFLIIIIKNMKKYFTFEITILDDKNMHRRFRVSNFQSTTRIRPFSTSMPIGLSGGWNQIQFNLSDFTRRAYEDEMPEEFKLFLPMHRKKCVREEDVPKKPSVILEKVPSVEIPIEPEEEILEPPVVQKPDLIEKAIPERVEEVKEIITKKDEEEEAEEEAEEAEEEAEEAEEAEEIEEAKKEEEEIKVKEEKAEKEEEKVEATVVEEKVEPAAAIQ
ncbi:PREDICTED: cilia- and flagella-associated protein 20-like [Atta colombica]|uniref:cilia- and flagella-associated protein 20-like n=1 Tax=Atta colombica TaxID=520822 RepID=UPI00084CBE93|nr:PREDICTED: cilia- and flagella-associated protein 20-like [Atta colombica]